MLKFRRKMITDYYKANMIGFTVVELMVVVSLLTLFSALAAPFGIEFYREQALEEETQTLANNLKITQSRAMAGKDNIAWGIEFLQGEYVIFRGSTCEEGEAYRTVQLRGGIETEGASCILFEKGTGDPGASAEITVKYGEDRSRIINVTEGGVIETTQ